MIDSRCGLHCTGCAWRDSQGCGGCIETLGHPFHGACKIALCCQGKELAHCGECAEIPCDSLFAYSYLDAEHGDNPPGARVAQCRAWAAEDGRNAWRNVLLTSAGFEDMQGKQRPHIVNRFLQMLNKPAGDAKVLFVPTAAIDDEAKEMADWCRRELIGVGILPGHITVYDIDGSMSLDEAMAHDVIYFTGGDTRHLLGTIKRTGFDAIIKHMVCANKVYVGVSAGSLIATPNIGDSSNADTSALALIHACLSVHCPEGTEPRQDLALPHIPLTDDRALAVSWAGYELI